MPRNTVGPQPDQSWAQDYYYQPASPAGTWPAAPDAPPRAAKPAGKTAADHQTQRRTAKSRVDEWMEVDFKFGGSRIKRKAVAVPHRPVPILQIVHVVPVNRRIASQHSKASSCRKLLVDGTHKRKKLFNES